MAGGISFFVPFAGSQHPRDRGWGESAHLFDSLSLSLSLFLQLRFAALSVDCSLAPQRRPRQLINIQWPRGQDKLIKTQISVVTLDFYLHKKHFSAGCPAGKKVYTERFHPPPLSSPHHPLPKPRIRFDSVHGDRHARKSIAEREPQAGEGPAAARWQKDAQRKLYSVLLIKETTLSFRRFSLPSACIVPSFVGRTFIPLLPCSSFHFFSLFFSLSFFFFSPFFIRHAVRPP